MTLFLQSMIFVIMMLTGIVLGLWIDLYKFINRRGRLPFPPLLDLLFWAVITTVVFVVLMNVNFLELRMYVFFSLGLGLYLYFKLLSSHILSLYSWGFSIIVKVIKWLWRISRPLGLPFRIVSGLFDNIFLALINLIAQILVRARDYRSPRQDNSNVA